MSITSSYVGRPSLSYDFKPALLFIYTCTGSGVNSGALGLSYLGAGSTEITTSLTVDWWFNSILLEKSYPWNGSDTADLSFGWVSISRLPKIKLLSALWFNESVGIYVRLIGADLWLLVDVIVVGIVATIVWRTVPEGNLGFSTAHCLHFLLHIAIIYIETKN